MKHSAIILFIAAMLLASCGKSSTDSNRVRELEEENARLRRAAGQSAALVPAEKPPKNVLDDAVENRFRKNTGYTVTNSYTRQIQDETFHVYEFDVGWISSYPGRADIPEKSQIAIGFVKRGNSWYSRNWKNDE